jgi:hypothetical protein
MDLFILDDQLRRTEVLDRYESLIWTDRWMGMGEFELVIDNSLKNRQLLRKSKQLVIHDSDRIMTIQTIEIKDDSEGRSMLTVRGRSLEYILDDRVAKASFNNLTVSPRWALQGSPGYIVRAIVQAICLDGILSPDDIVPYLRVPLTQGASIWPPDTIPESNVSQYMELEPKSLYEAVSDICTANSLGFGILRKPDKPELYFEVWSGSDRTTNNAAHIPPVIFSPDMDNLTNVTELISKETYKNTAYVLSDKGTTIVYGNSDGNVRNGLNRRVLLVKVDNVRENTNENYLTIEQILQLRGKEALAKHRQIHAFDGEISKSSQYVYLRDYRLGDIVELRKSDDIATPMRVSEQIFVSDSEGDRAYPTLSSDDPQGE